MAQVDIDALGASEMVIGILGQTSCSPYVIVEALKVGIRKGGSFF